MHKIKIKETIVKRISEYAEEFGVEVYTVGGYVRDVLLNRKRKDIDFTVVGDSIAFSKFVGEKLKREPIVFERFRTAMIPYRGYQLEFVGTRKEEYLPNSRKPIVSIGTLEDDLKRRDFTINALAANLSKERFGEVIDLFNGLYDLKNKILRTPLDPFTTYSDDPLRMMRAARFAAQLEFQLHQSSVEAIIQMADRIKIISQERITDEFLKILSANKPSIGLLILKNTGLLKYIFPELDNLSGVEIIEEGGKQYKHKDVFLHSLKVLDNVSLVSDKLWLRFAALTHDIGKYKTKRITPNGWTFHGHEELGAKIMPNIFRRMRFPLDNLEYVQRLIRLHQRPMQLVDEIVTDSAIRRLAFQAGDALEDLFILCKADITTKNPYLEAQYLNNYDIVAQKVLEVQEKDKLREFQSPVRGEEIMKICNLPPSKPVGIIKGKIEDAILDGIIPNEYEAALNYFLENKDKWLSEIGQEEFSKIRY
ncbi:MAG: CCA tRNA nucleotidyltransferase [Bacteroidota bacterium]